MPLQGQTPKLVILGTGTPNADPERSGPAVAVVAGERSYLFDAGPGIVRRAARAARDLDLPALEAARLERVFLTHLHSDHTTGLPDLLLAPFVLDRPGPLQIAGPPGTRKMVRHIEEAWTEDVHMRLFGLEPREENPDAWRGGVLETTGGLVHEDEAVRIEALPVDHGSWPYALGYRIDTQGGVIVISGDTRPSETIVQECDGCSILVHEVYSSKAFQDRPPAWRRYHSRVHTSTEELARVAQRARPKLLVLYHQLFWGVSDEDLVAEIRTAGYDGPVVSAGDLSVFEPGAAPPE